MGKNAKYAYPAIPAKKTAVVRENLFTKDFCSSVFSCNFNVFMTGKNRIKFNDIDWINKLNKLKKGFQTTTSGKILCKI